jgi:MFS family permease
MGYFGLASSLAMIATPALSLALFYTWGGAAASLVCAGFFALALLCSCFVVYIKLPPYKKPEKVTRRSPGAFIMDELLEHRALIAALLMMLTASSYGIVQSFLPAMEEARGIAQASLFFMVMAVAALIARPAFGRWADRRGIFAPALTAFAAMAASMIMLAWAYSPLLLLSAAVLQGVGYSAGFSLFLALATVKAEPSKRGSAIATVMVGFDIGAGVSAVVLGLFISAMGYAFAFIGGACLALLGCALTLYFRKRLGSEKV